MRNVVSLAAKRQEQQTLRLPKEVRNLKLMLEAVKEAEAKAQLGEISMLEAGEVLNNLYSALLCSCEAVVESAETHGQELAKVA